MNCVFCPNPGGNNEHLIAKWLIHATGYKKKVQVAYVSNGIVVRSHHPRILFRTTSMHCCADCNNGWMSQLENRLKKLLGRLVEPTGWPEDCDAIICNSFPHVRDIVRWLLKSAIMADTTDVTQRAIAPEIATELYADRLCSDLVAEIGYIQQPHVGAVLRRSVRGNHGEPIKYKVFGQSFDFIIQLNHLALRLYRLPGITVSYELRPRSPVEEYANSRGLYHCSRPCRIFPRQCNPTVTPYHYRTLADFQNQLEANFVV